MRTIHEHGEITLNRSPEMRRLDKAEVDALARRLRSWSSPAEFGATLLDVERVAGFYAVSQGPLKIWREAFVAMSCAQLSHANEVRLGEDPPDFLLRYPDHERAFEIVDVWPEGRRLHEEYNRFADLRNSGQGIPIEHIDMEGELNALPTDLERQIRKKSTKNYPPGLILVADIHHAIFPGTDFPIEQNLARIARTGLARFDEVWLRMSAHILRITSQGSTRMSPIPPVDY